MGWLIAGVVAFLFFDFVMLLGIAASASSRDAFSQEVEDREQIEAIREYVRKRDEKAKNKRIRKST